MPPVALSNPYPGLRPFKTDEDYLFFGREGQSEELLRRLRLNRFLAVIGISGSGKSSLIRAGLLPYIYGGFMAGASSHWRVALFRPGDNPIGSLAHALSDSAVLGDAGSGEKDAQKSEILLEITLRRSGLGLVEAVRLARLAEQESLLIVVDQFEELFRYGHASSSLRQQDDAAAFVKLLSEAAQQSDLPIYVIITMRSDFIGDCARFRNLPEAVTAGLYLIPRMSRDQRRKAIEEPVRVGGATISRRLVNRLLNDGGDDPDQLPSLQHALMRTWIYWQNHGREENPIDVDDYLAIGGIGSALSRHAEEAYADLPDDRSRAIAKRLFQSLTEKGPDNREVRRPTKLGAIADMADASVPETIAVIELFRREGRSFLTPPPDVALGAESVIDISHESLIRGWDRLKAWVEEEYESAKMYRRLAETAALYAEGKAGLWHDPDLANALRWQKNEKPTEAWGKCYHPGFQAAMQFLEESARAKELAIAERERSRRQKLRNTRLFAATVLLLFLVATAFAVSAVRETHKANENARRAEVERNNANEQKRVALQNEHKAAAAKRQADDNQDMALNFAATTVRGFSDLNDFTLSLNDVHDKFESLLKEAGKVHNRVLNDDQNNFAASVMKVNAFAAMSRLHRVTGHSEIAEKECARQEAQAAQLGEAKDAGQRILGAYTLATLAGIRKNLGEKERALADARRAVTIADTVDPAGTPNSSSAGQQALRCLSIAYSNAASVESAYGDQKTSIKLYSSAVGVFAGGKDASVGPGNNLDETSRSFLLGDMKSLADAQEGSKLTDDATSTYSKAIHLAGNWSRQAAPDANMIDNLVWLHIGLGDIKDQQKQYSQAQREFEAAKAIAATRMDRATSDGQYDQAAALERLADVEHYEADQTKSDAARQKELQHALALHEQALHAFQQMEEKRGKNPFTENRIGYEERKVAWDYAALGQAKESRTHYENSLGSFMVAAEFDQKDEYFTAVALGNRTLGSLDRDNGNWKSAIAHYAEALKFDDKISQLDDDGNNTVLQDIEFLGDSQSEDSQLDQAIATFTAAIARGEKLCSNPAASGPLTKTLIVLYLERGDVLRKQDKFTEASTDYASAQKYFPRMDAKSRDAKVVNTLICERFGIFWKARGEQSKDEAAKRDYFLKAKTFYRDALLIREEMRQSDTNAGSEEDVGLSNLQMGYLSYDMQDWAETHKYLVDSADAYVRAARLGPTPDRIARVQTAYSYVASADTGWGKDELAKGHYREAEKAFALARTAASRQDVPGIDSRALRAGTEETIAGYWRDRIAPENDHSRKDELARSALQADENALKLRREIASGNKTVENTRAVGFEEEKVGLDHRLLKNTQEARKYFQSAVATLQEKEPTPEGTRAVASAYEELAGAEMDVEEYPAARDALTHEIELMKSLVDKGQATQEDKTSLAEALGVRSWENALLGDSLSALADANQGLFVNDQLLFIRVNQGDAYVLLGQIDAARKVYLSIADEKLNSGTARDSILEDLETLKKHPELKVDPKVLASLQLELRAH